MAADTTNKLAEALKPCPFCGSVATITPQFQDREVSPGVDKPEYLGELVGCEDCSIWLFEESDDGAIAAWNRRAPAQAGEQARPPLGIGDGMTHRLVSVQTLSKVQRALQVARGYERLQPIIDPMPHQPLEQHDDAPKIRAILDKAQRALADTVGREKGK